MNAEPKKLPLTREDRVAAALRENLRKRKQQAHEKAAQNKDQKKCP